jgi:hypothetical protein
MTAHLTTMRAPGSRGRAREQPRQRVATGMTVATGIDTTRQVCRITKT